MKEVHDHSFNINVAEYFRSVEKAILLKELYGWVKINKDSKRNIHYSEAWTYNTSEAMNAKFRYMKPKSIWRWLDELSRDGFVCINRFNEKKYDKTNWYAVNWAAYVAICQEKNELIPDLVGKFKSFQRLVFDSQKEKSISQNKKRYSQNEKSISQDKEPIPSLTISDSSLTISEPFVENSFSTVTLIDEVDETSVEIRHVPEYFDDEKQNPTPQVAPPPPPRKKREKKLPDNSDPTPINAMWEKYTAAYATLNKGEEPVFHKKYLKSMKTLYAILHARTVKNGIVPLDNLQPWGDFLDMVVKFLKDNPKEIYLRGRFDPIGLEAEFNKIVGMLVAGKGETSAEKWARFAQENGLH